MLLLGNPQEATMATKAIRGYRTVTDENGKTKLQRVTTFRSVSAAIASKKSRKQRVVRRTV